MTKFTKKDLIKMIKEDMTDFLPWIEPSLSQFSEEEKEEDNKFFAIDSLEEILGSLRSFQIDVKKGTLDSVLAKRDIEKIVKFKVERMVALLERIKEIAEGKR